MSTLTADRIRTHATRLGLTHLADEADHRLVGRAEAAQLGYLDFVDLLLEEEVGLREGRRFRNALKLSGLPHHKTLDDFDFAFQPDLDARKVRDLATLGVRPGQRQRRPARPARSRQDPSRRRPRRRRLPGRILDLLHHPRRPGPPADRMRHAGRLGGGCGLLQSRLPRSRPMPTCDYAETAGRLGREPRWSGFG